MSLPFARLRLSRETRLPLVLTKRLSHTRHPRLNPETKPNPNPCAQAPGDRHPAAPPARAAPARASCQPAAGEATTPGRSAAQVRALGLETLPVGAFAKRYTCFPSNVVDYVTEHEWLGHEHQHHTIFLSLLRTPAAPRRSTARASALRSCQASCFIGMQMRTAFVRQPARMWWTRPPCVLAVWVETSDART